MVAMEQNLAIYISIKRHMYTRIALKKCNGNSLAYMAFCTQANDKPAA